jgi:hypothetical protein
MQKKIKINREGVTTSYENLQPIVDFLIASGNEVMFPERFIPSPGGLYCRMKNKIDIDLIRETFELPETIKLSENPSSIFDLLTWTEIS